MLFLALFASQMEVKYGAGDIKGLNLAAAGMSGVTGGGAAKSSPAVDLAPNSAVPQPMAVKVSTCVTRPPALLIAVCVVVRCTSAIWTIARFASDLAIKPVRRQSADSH